MMPKISFIQVKSLLQVSCLVLGLTACPPATPPDPCTANPVAEGCVVESAPPSVTVTPEVPTTAVDFIITTQEQKGIGNASIVANFAGQTPIEVQTDTTGKGSFPDLRLDGVYTFEISAPGYISTSRQVDLSQFVRNNPTAPLFFEVQLGVHSTTLSGKAMGTDGKVLEHAVVFDGRQSTLTDKNGLFTLSYTSPADIRLVIAKQGYSNHVSQHKIELEKKLEIGTQNLTKLERSLVVGFDATKMPLGQTGGVQLFQTLIQNLTAQAGYNVQTITAESLEDLQNYDILVIPSPAGEYSVAEISAIQAFVLTGRKLIVLGEWGGFGGFSGKGVNQLLEPYGIQFGGDTLRENNTGYLELVQFQNHPVTQGIQRIKVYQSSTIQFLAHANASLLARTSQAGFRIAAQGSFGILGAGIFGAGRILVLGDASMWLDEDSDQNGIPNLQEADNLKLALQSFAW